MNKICAAIVALTLVSGLSINSFAQKQPKRSAVFIGGGASTGAVVNRNRVRSAQPRVLVQSSDLYAKSRSKSRTRVRGRKLIGTTYGGDGPETFRKGVKR